MSEKRPDYINDAMEMIGIDLDTPRKIIQEVSGFTPIFDVVADALGNVTASVHGCAWRFCQMEDGVCKASLSTMAKLLGMDESTVSRHLKILVDNDFFKDLTPDLRNKPHVYADTGKVIMRSKMTARLADSNARLAHSKATVAESRMSKDIKKDLEEKDPAASPLLSDKELSEANQMVDAIIASSNGEHWQGRETFRPDHYPLVDWYHKTTGQDCPKSKRKDWHKALLMWSANNLTVADLQAAYDMDIKWRGVFTSPNQLTDKAIALRAQKQTQPEPTHHAPIPERIRTPRPAHVPPPRIGGNHD